MIVTYVDDYFLRAKVSVPYPSILIEDKNVEALPILLSALEEGEISVIFEYGGKLNVPQRKISCSALTLSKLLQVYKYTLLKSKEERFPIRTVEDIMEVGTWN